MTYDDAFMDGYYSAMEDMDDDYSYEGYYDEYDDYDPAYEEYMNGYYAAMEDAAARAAARGNDAADRYYENSKGYRNYKYRPELTRYVAREKAAAAIGNGPRSHELKKKLHDYFGEKDGYREKYAPFASSPENKLKRYGAKSYKNYLKTNVHKK